ncbi:TetR/AcrR family transcriptional regulator [Actinomadura parmotrematis]|uniref:TetR family transcriptional regulator n=1 Tax=Actinomadura parmotrematis TaxID=2864039 RepID=A0ABS7FNZ3_9ACTN|nr:TetR family transcriptional regulator [Actinomadura parmotrematis]MBW8482105.1 TetR family transcriptional regulator [Actinomadura parmotrematis]
MVGLRERKKEATRRALHEAAVRLATEHGLDGVTVEAIADAVGVSRRTFSNYFEGKEDAVLYGDRERMRDLLDAFAARPAREPAWTALTLAVHGAFLEAPDEDRDWAVRGFLMRRHPSLLARQLGHFAALEQRLAELIAEREGTPPDSPRPRVMAAAFLTGIRLGLNLWTEDQARTRAEVVERTLAEMARPFQ